MRKRSAARVPLLLSMLIVGMLQACAGSRPPDPTKPGATVRPAYPVFMAEDKQRRDATIAEWNSIIHEQGILKDLEPELQPVIDTVRRIPDSAKGVLALPKVGQGAVMSEEETRESLRRFIASAPRLIGAEPRQLSLEQRTDMADGNKRATYQQRPFRSPLRGGYGLLDITFSSDRRLVALSSTCIPNVENLQRSGARTIPQITAEDAVKRIPGKSFSTGTEPQQTFTVAANQEVSVNSLVVYPRLRSGQTELEFHLAWEIKVPGSPVHLVYMDVIDGEILGTT